MPARKKRFECGHKAFGKICRRCIYLENERLRYQRMQEQKELERRELEAIAKELGVNPAGYRKNVLLKAYNIVKQIREGAPFARFNWRLLKAMGQREIIRIKVDRCHRLIFRVDKMGTKFLELLTHERYNTRLASGGWLD
jgi:hypothetical protein